MTDNLRNRPLTGSAGLGLNRGSRVSAVAKSIAAASTLSTSRPLYGVYDDLGVSIQVHDFHTAKPTDWARGFKPHSIVLCLNLSGFGSIQYEDSGLNFGSLTGLFFLPGRNALQGWRQANQSHLFVTIEFSVRYLRQYLAGCDGALHPLVERFMLDESPLAGLGEVHRLSSEQEQLAGQLVRPPIFQGARDLWYQAKTLQLIVDFFFGRQGDDELFCDRQKRLARDRVDRVMGILRQHLSEPPGLEEIGREVGCSPFHLSRTFSRATGMTIPQYVRKLRMERAAELLRSGKYNVTEAALEVGYSSLSHFSQAFCQVIGCCPGLYPLKTPTQAAATRGNTCG